MTNQIRIQFKTFTIFYTAFSYFYRVYLNIPLSLSVLIKKLKLANNHKNMVNEVKIQNTKFEINRHEFFNCFLQTNLKKKVCLQTQL